jgi:hypothetical protein
MSRVLAVTRRATHVLELRRQGFDVIDLRPGAVPNKSDVVGAVAVLVDLGDLAKTRATLGAVRSHNAQVPAVVLGHKDGDWLSLEADGHTLLVVPPVSFSQVAGAIRTLASPPEASPEAPPAATGEPLPRTLQPVAAFEPSASEPTAADLAGVGVTTTTLVDPVPMAEPAAATALATAPRRGRIRGRSARRRPPVTVEVPAADVLDWRAAASLMLTRLDTVPGPGAVSDELATELCAIAEGEAAAVMVAEDGCWRVEGGVGLRPIEYRLTLSSSDWVVAQLSAALPVVAVADTDVVRAQLALTPLARYRSLLAVAFADGDCLGLVGRNHAPFESGEVVAVLHRLRRGSADLAEALDARRVARGLVRYL